MWTSLWVKDECTLHVTEVVVVQDCTSTENFTPHPFNALVVYGLSASRTTDVQHIRSISPPLLSLTRDGNPRYSTLLLKHLVLSALLLMILRLNPLIQPWITLPPIHVDVLSKMSTGWCHTLLYYVINVWFLSICTKVSTIYWRIDTSLRIWCWIHMQRYGLASACCHTWVGISLTNISRK